MAVVGNPGVESDEWQYTWIVVVVRLDRNADMLYRLISVEWSFMSLGI